mgnify:CR=1 FL=1
MITWIQTVLQKHNKVMFSALLIIVTVTFVLTIGNQSFFGSRATREYSRKDFFGYDLQDSTVKNYIILSGELSAMLHPERQVNPYSVQTYAYNRIAALGLARQLGIVAPTDEEMQNYIKNVPMFQGENGKFSKDGYSAFIASIMRSSRYSKDMLARTLKDDFRIDRVVELMGGPGFVLPYEVKQMYLQSETQWDVQLASMDASTFNPEIDANTEALMAFYTSNPEAYREPEKVKTDVVLFKTENYLSEVETPDEATLKTYYESNKNNYIAKDTASTDVALPEPFEKVSDQVLVDYKKDQAKQIAVQKADDFTVALFRHNTTRGSEVFNKTVTEFGGVIEPVAPFSKGTTPKATKLPSILFDSSWNVFDETRYYSDLATYDGGAAVLILKGRIDARIPAFDEVKDQVLINYKAREKQRLFVEKGKRLSSELKTAVTEGKDFSKTAETLGMTAKTFDTFKLSEQPPAEIGSFYDVLLETDAGQVSETVFNGNAAQVIYVSGKKVPDVSDKQEELTKYGKSFGESLKTTEPWLLFSEISNSAMDKYENKKTEES